MSFKAIEPLLRQVQKPGRYTGGEPGSIDKSAAQNAGELPLRYALCFPDTYEIGMSHLGMKILYGLANSREDCWCERVFAPWTDMEKLMRAGGTALWGLESGEPIAGFDLVGFTLQYEMSYSNILNMLDLAGIPLRAAARGGALAPLVIGGGPCACNPEPLAPFFDLFVLGDGEQAQRELLDLLAAHKKRQSSKAEFLRAAAKLEGVYVPSLYTVTYNRNGLIEAVEPAPGAPARVKKRVVRDLDSCYFPERFVVPLLEVVHDRTVTELFRGCIRGCRFCQAGYLGRPVREKSPAVVDAQCRALCENTGYEEVSLCSLSTSDYSALPELLDGMLDWTLPRKINVSVPSLRIDRFPREMMERLALLRRGGLTFAPEAGSQRLRDVINKNITQEQVLSTARQAFSGGWTSVKLYFMIGLPTETREDIAGIAQLAQAVTDEFYRNPDKPKGKGVTVSLSAASFVPKPFTPFQWEAMDTKEQLDEKQVLLRSHIRSKKISLSCHHADISLLEGVFARGDRRLADVLEAAWRAGARFDGWDDQFKPELWRAAFESRALDPRDYTREREESEILPWDHLNYGVTKAFLLRERARAYRGETTPNCREACAGCGADECRIQGG
ncbi:MAG: TIGR03960 family B12-binding radical SAM protein [Oscillospiraceae bacterium]|nr:TIGR03960 family B12-binding radical SAM protein [Oscillospiraceae bacterium]